MLANFFQVFFSLAYVAWNSFISCMLVADEWCGFAKNRKTLRVSAPVGIQRSSYTLSMPLRYGIPMTIISLLLHWLISQSIFIVRVNKFDYSGDHGRGWTVTGYSFMPSLVGKGSSLTQHFRISLAYQDARKLSTLAFYILFFKSFTPTCANSQTTAQCRWHLPAALLSVLHAIVLRQTRRLTCYRCNGVLLMKTGGIAPSPPLVTSSHLPPDRFIWNFLVRANKSENADCLLSLLLWARSRGGGALD